MKIKYTLAVHETPDLMAWYSGICYMTRLVRLSFGRRSQAVTLADAATNTLAVGLRTERSPPPPDSRARFTVRRPRRHNNNIYTNIYV